MHVWYDTSLPSSVQQKKTYNMKIELKNTYKEEEKI